jgi:hypothetical protein
MSTFWELNIHMSSWRGWVILLLIRLLHSFNILLFHLVLAECFRILRWIDNVIQSIHIHLLCYIVCILKCLFMLAFLINLIFIQLNQYWLYLLLLNLSVSFCLLRHCQNLKFLFVLLENFKHFQIKLHSFERWVIWNQIILKPC